MTPILSLPDLTLTSVTFYDFFANQLSNQCTHLLVNKDTVMIVIDNMHLFWNRRGVG